MFNLPRNKDRYINGMPLRLLSDAMLERMALQEEISIAALLTDAIVETERRSKSRFWVFTIITILAVLLFSGLSISR